MVSLYCLPCFLLGHSVAECSLHENALCIYFSVGQCSSKGLFFGCNLVQFCAVRFV